MTEQLNDAELYDVLEFARNMYNIYPGVYNPDLVNARIKDVTLNPIIGTKEQIDAALADPKNNETQLVGYSEYFELVDMLYKRQLYYLGNLLSWDLTYTCINSSEKDYTSKEYISDEKIMTDFLDKFNAKQEFQKICRQIVRNETYFAVFREDSDEQYVLQELPSKYCKITGRWEKGFLFDFDMIYFLSNPGVDINCFPDVFKKYYNRIMKNNKNGYIPSKDIDHRTGNWVLWTQTSPVDGFWAFKMTPEIAAQVPIFSPLFSDLSLRPTVRQLQTNKYIIEASKVLIGLIGFNKDPKSASVKDALNVSAETAGKFANLIRQGLSKEIQFGIAPFSQIESFEWKSDGHNMMDEYNKTTTAQSGTNTKLLYGSDKMNLEDSRNSISIDEQLVEFIYPYFADFLNFYVNKRTKKFKFKFKFEGTNLPASKESRKATAMELAQMGIVLPQKIAAAIGMLPHEFERQLAMGRASKFVDKLTPIVSAFQMSGKENGRPQKKTSELSESGEQTRSDGGNIGKGGKI